METISTHQPGRVGFQINYKPAIVFLPMAHLSGISHGIPHMDALPFANCRILCGNVVLRHFPTTNGIPVLLLC